MTFFLKKKKSCLDFFFLIILFKTTTSDNAGPTAMKDEKVGGLDPLANPFLAQGGTALEGQKGAFGF
jgi:hypothetical protein